MRLVISGALCLLFSCLSGYSQSSDFDNKIKQITQQLVQRLASPGERRMAVVNFTDLQGNVTELGKYLAEVFSVELVNSGMQVVDRSTLSYLLTELRMTEEKLINPSNALKLGEMASVQFIITGTTTLLDNSVDITIKALEIQKGTIASAQRGNVPRTDAINALFRSQVSGNGIPSVVTTMPDAAGNQNVDARDDVNQVKVSDMKKNICKDQYGVYYGYICFENQFTEDLVLYLSLPATQHPNTLIPVGGKGCSLLVPTTSAYASEPASVQTTFYFNTTDKEKPMYGKFTVVVEGCVTKSVTLHKRNFFVQKEKLH